jgi:hypothetical protein
LKWTSATGVEAAAGAEGAAGRFKRKYRRWHAIDARQVLQVVVERFQRSVGGGDDDIVEAALGFASVKRAAHVERALYVGLDARQHGETAGDVKSANDDSYAGLAQGLGDVERPGKLIGLNANEPDEPARAPCLDLTNQLVGADPHVRFVDGRDVDIDVWSENFPVRRVFGQRMQSRERIGGNQRLLPLDDVAFVIVM